MIRIDIGSFTGEVAISNNRFNTDNINSFITRYRRKYASELIGPTMFNQIMESDSEKWDDFKFGVTYPYIDSTGTEKYEYQEGFVTLLKYLIYFELVKNDFRISDTGAVKNKNANSTPIKSYNIAKDRWNKAVAMIKPFFDFIERKKVITYATYDVTPETLPSVGYGFSIAGIPYIEVGDSIEIDGKLYTVARYGKIISGENVRTGTRLEIDTPDTLTINEVIARPFDLFDKGEGLTYIYL